MVTYFKKVKKKKSIQTAHPLTLKHRQYIDTAYTALIGKPSLTMTKRLIEEENLRIEAQKACLGEQGLQILKAKLNHATSINETQIPSKIMESFPIPSVSSISSIEVLSAVNPPPFDLPLNCVQAHVNRDGHVNDVPYFIQYDRNVP